MTRISSAASCGSKQQLSNNTWTLSLLTPTARINNLQNQPHLVSLDTIGPAPFSLSHENHPLRSCTRTLRWQGVKRQNSNDDPLPEEDRSEASPLPCRAHRTPEAARSTSG